MKTNQIVENIIGVKNSIRKNNKWIMIFFIVLIIFVPLIDFPTVKLKALAYLLICSGVTVSIIYVCFGNKEMEKAFLHEQHLLNAFMENSPDVVYFKDSESRFLKVSRAFSEKFKNQTTEDIPGKTDFDIFNDEHAQTAFDDEQEIMRTGIPIIEKEEKEVFFDGSVKWVLSNKLPLLDNNGQVVGTFGVSRDITEEKQTKEELEYVYKKQASYIRELEQRSRDIIILNEMSDLLQACNKMAEAYQVIGELARQLLPNENGALYVINPSGTLAEKVCSWGDKNNPINNDFHPNDCWGLRLGHLHTKINKQSTQGNASSYISCNHVDLDNGNDAYVCVPLIAQGKSIGLIHIQPKSPNEKEWLSEAKEQLVRNFATSSALALANLNLRESLREQSIRDVLTGLFNRRYMEETFEREIKRAQRFDRPLGVLMLDVDHFKKFNNTYGHAAGDLVLKKLGELLATQTRGEDIPCRYGGEEFILIMPEAPLTALKERAEQIRNSVKNIDLTYNGQKLNDLTISIGVSSFPEHGNEIDEIIKIADQALYKAKKNGRDQVVVAEI